MKNIENNFPNKKLLSFREFEELQEALVTFGNKAYPKFGNVVILAGGAGSGKGFVQKTVLGIEGKTFDVDATKKLAIDSERLAQRIKQETGQDISKFNLKDPTNVTKLHVVLADVLNLKQSVFNKSILQANPKRLPNIVFDVTLRDWKKFVNLSEFAKIAGYEKENIHLVWVVNSVDTAKAQNAKRARVVPEEILVGTHVGAAKTFKDVINLGDKIGKHIDGDIWIVFNNKDVGDAKVKKSDAGGSFVEKIQKIKLKKAGQRSISAIPKEFLQKLKDYTKTSF